VARCEALEITDGWGHIRALALAEAKAGRHASAAERLDRLIARGSGRNPALVAADLEARALVAIWARDHAGAAHFTELATRSTRNERTALELARRGRLIDEAARAGIPLDLPASGFESVVLGHANQPAAPAIDAGFLAALEALRDPQTRAQRALTLLCEAAIARGGHLYTLQADSLALSASLGAPVDSGLDDFAQGYLQHHIEQAAMSTVFTATEQTLGALPVTTWRGSNGATYSLVPLKRLGRDRYFGALALLTPSGNLRGPQFSAIVSTISARLIDLSGTQD
jgi:hypothetical protein